MDPSASDADWQRYQRQINYPPFGLAGQQRLARATVVIVGCGALGSVQADTLVRAGVGRVRIIDRDYLELNNLQRQSLYTERDVQDQIPKAIAAQRHLQQVNSTVEIEAVVSDFNFDNARRYSEGASLMLDGTDNFETRFLINDLAVEQRIPWVYGGCLGSDGQSMTIVPGQTPCLHCLMREGPPTPGTSATCDTAGILAPIIQVIAAWQCSEALKILSGNIEQINRKLISIGLWDNRLLQLDLSSLDSPRCPVCSRRQFDWLEGRKTSATAILCGRNAVQLSPRNAQPDLADLEQRLARLGSTSRNQFMLQAQIGPFAITLFPDGRAIIKGTEDVHKAKSLFAQWVGH